MKHPTDMIEPDGSDLHLLAYERSMWHTALTCDNRLDPITRGLAIDMVIDPRSPSWASKSKQRA